MSRIRVGRLSPALVAVMALTACRDVGDPKPRTPVPEAVRPFDALARRVRHFYERLESPDEATRRRLLTELTYFVPRDSALYPPYLRHLLKDPSPRLRWEALHRLWEHGIALGEAEVPSTFEVPQVGLLDRGSAQSLSALYAAAQEIQSPRSGWAVHALGLIGDRDAVPRARALLDSANAFVRFSAAAALVGCGERETGVAALIRLTQTTDDPSGFYRYRSAEFLVRLGRKEFLETLIALAEGGTRQDHADGPLQILEDLTGTYRPTPGAWRDWWEEQRKNER